MDKVDVIIPVWRTFPYLLELCTSMTEYDGVCYTFVVDYSDDETQDKEFNWLVKRAKALPNIQVLRSAHNLGLAGARNMGILATNAPYIIWMDSDDIFVPGSIGKRVAFMDAHPDVDFAYGSYLTFREKFDINESFGDPEINRRYTFEEIFQENRFSTCSGIIKREKFIPFDESVRVAEDYAWVLDHFSDLNYDFIPDCPCFYYRIRQDGLSMDKEAQKLHYDFIIKRKRKVRRKLQEKQNAG